MSILAKTFSRSDYNRCDGRAKAAGVALLRQRGHTNFDTQERMQYDILSTGPDGQPHHCEVEIKECWRGEWPAPWRSVHLPERRRRALRRWQAAGRPGQLVFLLFRSDLQQAWEVPADSLSTETLAEVPNKYVSRREKMFNVPLGQATLLRSLGSLRSATASPPTAEAVSAPPSQESGQEEQAPHFIC